MDVNEFQNLLGDLVEGYKQVSNPSNRETGLESFKQSFAKLYAAQKSQDAEIQDNFRGIINALTDPNPEELPGSVIHGGVNKMIIRSYIEDIAAGEIPKHDPAARTFILSGIAHYIAVSPEALPETPEPLSHYMASAKSGLGEFGKDQPLFKTDLNFGTTDFAATFLTLFVNNYREAFQNSEKPRRVSSLALLKFANEQIQLGNGGNPFRAQFIETCLDNMDMITTQDPGLGPKENQESYLAFMDSLSQQMSRLESPDPALYERLFEATLNPILPEGGACEPANVIEEALSMIGRIQKQGHEISDKTKQVLGHYIEQNINDAALFCRMGRHRYPSIFEAEAYLPKSTAKKLVQAMAARDPESLIKDYEKLCDKYKDIDFSVGLQNMGAISNAHNNKGDFIGPRLLVDIADKNLGERGIDALNQLKKMSESIQASAETSKAFDYFEQYQRLQDMRTAPASQDQFYRDTLLPNAINTALASIRTAYAANLESTLDRGLPVNTHMYFISMLLDDPTPDNHQLLAKAFAQSTQDQDVHPIMLDNIYARIEERYQDLPIETASVITENIKAQILNNNLSGEAIENHPGLVRLSVNILGTPANASKTMLADRVSESGIVEIIAGHVSQIDLSKALNYPSRQREFMTNLIDSDGGYHNEAIKPIIDALDRKITDVLTDMAEQQGKNAAERKAFIDIIESKMSIRKKTDCLLKNMLQGHKKGLEQLQDNAVTLEGARRAFGVRQKQKPGANV